jgi:hypothetical protein
MLMISLLVFYDVIPIKLNLKVKMTLDVENPLSLERHKAKGQKNTRSSEIEERDKINRYKLLAMLACEHVLIRQFEMVNALSLHSLSSLKNFPW